MNNPARRASAAPARADPDGRHPRGGNRSRCARARAQRAVRARRRDAAHPDRGRGSRLALRVIGVGNRRQRAIERRCRQRRSAARGTQRTPGRSRAGAARHRGAPDRLLLVSESARARAVARPCGRRVAAPALARRIRSGRAHGRRWRRCAGRDARGLAADRPSASRPVARCGCSCGAAGASAQRRGARGPDRGFDRRAAREPSPTPPDRASAPSGWPAAIETRSPACGRCSSGGSRRSSR